MKDLIYVTGNKYKVFVAKKILEPCGINVIQKDINCPEIQANEIADVAKFSAEYACAKLGCAVLKNDSGLIIPALKGFPSTYTRYVEETIGEDGILKLMENVKNREAYYIECLAFAEPGKETKLFASKSFGWIDTKKSGEYGWSYDKIFIPKGQTKTMANFNDDDRTKFWAETAYFELGKYLNKEK